MRTLRQRLKMIFARIETNHITLFMARDHLTLDGCLDQYYF